MKKIYILFVFAVVVLSSCGRNYTCPVYSKASVPVQEQEAGQASVKGIEKGKI
jgi:hypothetical protein